MKTTKDKFEFCDNSGTHSITSKNILCCADSGRVVAVFYNEHDLISATGLVKKVGLIDGKAYQFDIMHINNGVMGIYSASDDEFVYLENVCRPDDCTNIQLLEVK